MLVRTPATPRLPLPINPVGPPLSMGCRTSRRVVWQAFQAKYAESARTQSHCVTIRLVVGKCSECVGR
jgi:hypothetical protein